MSESTVPRCVLPAGASPAPVRAGTPGSRPHPSEGDLAGRAGCHKPVRQRELCSGEQARGPQHQVKPAASTDEQSRSRAAHVTAKATLVALVPERAASSGGVWGAARVQGRVRNTGGPSAQSTSRQRVSYKPVAKSAAVQRESEGIEVLQTGAGASGTNAVWHNAAGGKDPWGGRGVGVGKREGMAGETGPNNPGGGEPHDNARQLRRRLWVAAKRRPRTRLHVQCRPPAEVTVLRGRGSACCVRRGRVMLQSERPPVSRVREIRTHGLRGGLDFQGRHEAARG